MNPATAELLAEYQRRRARAVQGTAGPYLDDRSNIVGASDSMLQRAVKARETFQAIAQDVERGTISEDRAKKLRKTVVADVRAHIDKTAATGTKVLDVLPDRLLADAFPLHHERSAATSEAKMDLDRELGSTPPGDLPAAFAETVRRRYADGDTLAADLLLGAHGRDRLAAAGVPDAETVHKALRRDLAKQVPAPKAERGHAAATLGRVGEWRDVFTIGLNVADMVLRDVEEGRYRDDA